MPKKDAYYFSHDANAQDDPKCMVLIDQLGVEGYGIFWLLVEKLRAESEYKLPLIVLESFAKRWGTSKEKVNAVVKNYNLFVIENDEFFYSNRLKSSMEIKSIKAKESANKRWDKQLKENNNADVMRLHNDSNTNAMQNDAIKVKESKEKKVLFNNSNLFDKNIFKSEFPEWNTKKLLYYYEAAIAYSNEGNKYVNWKSAINNWAKRDELQGKLKFESINKSGIDTSNKIIIY
jgi:hypothetical protein